MSNQQTMERLDWPDGFDRTPPHERESYPHGFRVTRSTAFDNILQQLRRMDATNVQLDTGAEHQKRNPNKPYANSSFDDPGVVVRYEKDGQQFAIPCDKWDNPRDNAQAIARYIDAKRAIERYGVSTVGDEFSANQLPSKEDVIAAPAARSHHDVLNVGRDAPEPVVRDAYRERVKEAHPDNGGSQAELRAVREAKEALLDG